MHERSVSPWVRQGLELGPLAAFLAAYVLLRERSVALFWPFDGVEVAGFVAAVLLFVPVQTIAVLILWRLVGRLSRLQIGTTIVILLLGLGTVLFNDERFFKMKSTFVFGSFGVILLIGLVRGTSLLEWVLGERLPLSRAGWLVLTRRFAWFFLVFAAVNELIWRNFSTDLFVLWDTVGQMALMIAFVLSNWRLIDQHWTGPR